MSVACSHWVWMKAPVKSGELVVLLALADNAHDDGSGSYPSQKLLAQKSRLSERQVRNCLQSLEDQGLIIREGLTDSGVVIWRVLMGSLGGEDISPPPPAAGFPPPRQPIAGGGGSLLPTEPSIEPSSNRPVIPLPPYSRIPVVTFNRRKIPLVIVEKAMRVVDMYNDRTKQKIAAVKKTGQPAEILKMVCGALLEHDEPEDGWEGFLDRNLRNPWWTGDPSPNVLFSPRSIEGCLQNTGTPRNGSGSGKKYEMVGNNQAEYQALSDKEGW